nr:HlyD family efflux transporter periplasmic adaptor subunit [uncultured Caldimonas sp.]
MNKKRMLYIGAASAAIVAVLAWAFAPRPVEVEVSAASVGRFERTIDEDGRTRLRDRYVVSAPLAGHLSRVTLREGDTLAADAPIATLTPALSPMLDERTVRELRARVDAAQAMVKRAGARIGLAQVSREQARNEVRRSEELAAQGYVSATKLETDRLALRAAQKEYEAAEEDHHVAEYDLAQARAALEAIRQPGTGATRAFVVRSPIAGTVLRVSQTSEAMVGLGAPLVEVGDTRRLEVLAELLTSDALQTPPGTSVRIERWGGEGVLEGRVRLVEPSAFTKVSALGVEEQRVNVLIDITSPAEQWQALGDGFRVSVSLVVQNVDRALRVPVSAVFPQPAQAGMAVFTIDGGRARLVPVEVGARNGVEAWIKSGLAAGTQVIVYPPSSVTEGVRVKARKP